MKTIKYLCDPCNFSTNNKTDYNLHIKTNKHYDLSLICKLCNKSFTQLRYLKQHGKRKTSCISNKSTKSNELSQLKSKIDHLINIVADLQPNHIDINSYKIVNNNLNYTFILDTSMFKNPINNYAKNLLSNNVYSLTNSICQTNVQTYFINCIKQDFAYLDILKSIDFTDQDILNINSNSADKFALVKTKFKPIISAINNAPVVLQPSFTLSYDYIVKVWMDYKLLNDNDIANIKEESLDWITNNNLVIQEYLTNKIQESIIETCINPIKFRFWNLFPQNDDIYYKDNKTPINNLELLTQELLGDLISNTNCVNTLIYDKLNKYQISNKSFEIEFTKIKNTIYKKLCQFINNELHIPKQLN